MPRGPRRDAPGVVQHIMLRGIERRPIFHDPVDREAFATRLERLVPALGFRCFAWAFLPNHVHFALQTGPTPVARLMARLGTGYARYFNTRHKRVGHLFQNRYRSRTVDGERDLQGLVLYIHQNPVRAGLVSDVGELEHFTWCGHGACAGTQPARAFESPEDTLLLFGDRMAEARRNLALRMNTPTELRDVPPILSPRPVEDRKRPWTSGEAQPDLDDLIDEVCEKHGVSRLELGRGRRAQHIATARAELAQRATRDLGLPSRAVARALGVSDSTVARALSRHRGSNDSTSRWPRAE
ncbi:MAG: transposase [Deltaproteobacteria bacterium]|nr:transposase [Deltaproteobacteria bacterium]MBW2396891.1 transposase [Deltaproteobacteria bacterium]